MKRRIQLIFILFCTAIFSASASQVSVSDAQNVALNFFKIATAQAVTRGPLTATLKYTKTETDGTISLYAFDMSPVKGFVIVSASDNDDPIIGYSTESAFVPTFSKTGMNEWINRWGQEIAYVENHHITAEPKAPSLWASYRQGVAPVTQKSSGVGPLCATTWDQSNQSGNPVLYNEDCPYDLNYGENAVTGCVATAMSQIMKYWNYPAKGTGIASYNDATTNGFSNDYGVLTFNFNTTGFNWAAMPNNLTGSTSAQDSAVSLLNYACGVSVNMDYGPSESGAWVIDSESTNGASAQKAYPLYFKYNANTIKAVMYLNYTTSAWIALMENEFNSGRPVQYQGYDVSAGGHTWVCDGYDVNNNLHMNWGWGGLDNGFFAVTNLDPSYDFTYNIGALIGIQPGVAAVATPQTVCAGDSSVLSVSGGPAIATYRWSPATGLNCTTCASPKASPATTTTYTVTVDSAGSSISGSVTVYVAQPHSLNYTLTDSSICNGNSTTLSFLGVSGLSISPASSVAWQDSLTAVLSPNYSTTYIVTSQSSVCGTKDTADIQVQVTQHTPVAVSLSSTTICYGSTSTLTYSGLNNVVVSPAGYSYSGGTNTIVFDPYYTTSFSVTGTTSCGSVYTDTFTIYVTSYSGTFTYTLSKSILCQGDTAKLIVTGGTGLQVTPANMVISAGNNTFLLIPDTNTTFFVSGYNAVCGGSSSLTLPVKVVKTGTLDYSLPEASTCSGNDVYIYLYGVRSPITSSPSLYFYSTDSVDYYAYAYMYATTTYTISAQSICGTYDTIHPTITVVPSATYTLQSRSICQGDSTLLTTVGLSSISISPNTAYRRIDSSHFELYPTASTTYSLYGYNCSNYYEYYSFSVNVVQPGVLNYTLTDSTICSGNETEIILNGIKNPTISPTEYLYMTDSTDYYTYAYPNTTTSYYVSGKSVCGSTVSGYITVHVSPLPNYTLATAEVCPGGSTTLKFTGLTNPAITPINTATWLNDSTIQLTPTTATYYYLSGTGCSNYYEDYSIYVGVRPSSTMTYSVDSEVCNGNDAYLNITGASNIVITPSVNLTYTDSFDAYAYIYPTNTTTYTINAKSECTNTDVSEVFNLYLIGTPSYILSKQTVCNHDSAMLQSLGLSSIQITPSANVSYLNNTSAYIFPSTTTTYNVTGYSTCTGSYFNQQFTIAVGSPPIATEAFDSVICPYDSTEICASAGFVSYNWSTGQSGLCIAATLPGYYYVVGTDANNCTSQSNPLHISILSGPSLHIAERNDTLFASSATSYQWMLNGNPIEGANGSTLVPTSAGTYTVELGAANGCNEVSDAFNLTAIKNVTENLAYEVYPNPSAGKWTIQTSGIVTDGTCEIFDNEGRLVYRSMITGSKYEIEPDLSSGIYLLKIFAAGEPKFIVKLVKL